MNDVIKRFKAPNVQKMAFPRENILPRLKNEFLVTFDPLQLAHAFYKCRMISKVVYDDIVNEFDNRSEREDLCRKLLNALTPGFPITAVLRILRQNGYDKLANKLLSVVYLKEPKIPCIGRTTTKPRNAAYMHFRTIKRNIHNKVWDNPYEIMRQRAAQFHRELKNEKNEIRRMCITDMLVAHLGAEIDAISIKFDEHFFDHSIFIELENLYKNSTNELIPKVIFLSRKVNAYAIGGNFEQGEQLLSDAMQCATDLSPCLELVNLYYLDVVFRLWKLEFHPSRELKSSLIDKANTGLQLLEYENDDVRLYLTRMFFIRMASGLLGIGNRGNIYPAYNIEDDDISAAKRFLSEVDRLWNGIEIRQEMFYSVARAKINQLEGDIEFAKKYSKRALELAREGNFREGESIEKYCRKLESWPRPLSQGSNNGSSEGRLPVNESVNQACLCEQQDQNITSSNVEEISTIDEHSFSSLVPSLRFSTFSERSSQQNMDSKAQSTSVEYQNPSSFRIYSVGKSLSFSLLSQLTSGQSVHLESALDISSLDFTSLFNEESDPKFLWSRSLSEGETSVNSLWSENEFVNLDFSSLFNETDCNLSNQNADNKDSKRDTPKRAAIGSFHIRNGDLPHQTFNVDDINSFALFQDRFEPSGASHVGTEVITAFSIHSSNHEVASNVELLIQQQMYNNIQRDNLPNRTVNLEDVDSIVLFEDRGEPEGNSTE